MLTPEQILNISLARKEGGFGFSITGGIDEPIEVDEIVMCMLMVDCQAGDNSVYISQIIPGSAAELDGRLRQGDRVLISVLTCLLTWPSSCKLAGSS